MALLSSSYSGATLVSMMVGTHPQIVGFGDTYNYQMVDLKSTRCTCGAAPSTTCPVRIEVEQEMARRGVPFSWLKSNPTPIPELFSENKRVAIISRKHRIWLPIYRMMPDSVRLKIFKRFYRENRALLETLGDIGNSCYFDGCKSISRLELMRTLYPDTKVVHWIKSPYSYLQSVIKRRGTINYKRTIEGWLRYNDSARRYRDILGEENYLLASYEDFTEAPQAVLAIIYRFMGLCEFDPIAANMDVQNAHVIGSSTKNSFRKIENHPPNWHQTLSNEQQRYIESKLQGHWSGPFLNR